MAERLSDEVLSDLFDAILASDGSPDAEAPAVIGALYRLLGFGGQPVTTARLAAEVGWDVARTQALVGSLPNVELDERGAVTGFGGLTLRPTAHRLVVAGELRYAWCAWDTLFLPVALDTPVEVRSDCAQSGRPIRLVVTPAGVQERDPPGTVLSFVHPDAVDSSDLRRSFCGHVNFLADPSAAQRWRRTEPSRLVLDLVDAFELGRRMIVNRCGACGPESQTMQETP